MSRAAEIAPGVLFGAKNSDRPHRKSCWTDVLAARAKQAPFYRPEMPGSGKPFSVEETNFGPLGWVSDRKGYRYQAQHPVTGKPWPAIPQSSAGSLWDEIADAAYPGSGPPQCCLVNLYRAGARMSLHQDKDEAALSAPVVSVSLGDEAVFRIGGMQKAAAPPKACGCTPAMW